jgi:2-polyprenyl-6-methoxyphenol hydroxylase-like FAD-dependent oxidoreductase
MSDPKAGTRWHATMSQWRFATTIGYTFPVPGRRVLCLLMPPAEEIAALRRAPEVSWECYLAQDPDGIGERLRGAGELSKIRSTAETSSFFRRSSGPGWALAGDAGHFEDPVIGSGQRDALRWGRMLGETAAPRLDGDPAALDAALGDWERARDRECNASYHWGCRESRAIDPATPLVREIIRTFAGGPRPLSDNFNRTRAPERVVGPRAVLLGLLGALHREPGRRMEVLREAAGELPLELGIRLDRWFGAFRASGARPTERPTSSWPPPPTRAAPTAPREAEKDSLISV